MRGIAAWIGLAALVAVAAPVGAEQFKVLDIRKNTSDEGRYMVLVSHSLKPRGPKGYALAAVATGESEKDLAFKGAFGFYLDKDKQALGVVTPEVIARVRAIAEDPQATTIVVRIDADQYKIASSVIADYSSRESFTKRDGIVCLDFTDTLLRKVPGLKVPYRSGLGGSNPFTYFSDLNRLNRPKKSG